MDSLKNYNIEIESYAWKYIHSFTKIDDIAYKDIKQCLSICFKRPKEYMYDDIIDKIHELNKNKN